MESLKREYSVNFIYHAKGNSKEESNPEINSLVDHIIDVFHQKKIAEYKVARQDENKGRENNERQSLKLIKKRKEKKKKGFCP